jgi:hypothetical protein
MNRSLLVLGLMLSSLFFGGCGGGRTGSAATMPDGSRIAIMVFTDRGITPDMAPDKVSQIEQLSMWMEGDLMDILNKTGYAASQTADPNTATGPGRYLLRVKITDYNAGSKAARMLVGWGAGAAVLNTHFELFGPDSPAPYVVGSPSVGSGRDWKNSARKVNVQTVDAVNARLHQH